MEVFEVVQLAKGDKNVSVNVSDLECKMLLTFAINELINRGSITLFSPEDQEKIKGLEELLERDVQGSA
jgi:hypothetical protein